MESEQAALESELASSQEADYLVRKAAVQAAVTAALAQRAQRARECEAVPVATLRAPTEVAAPRGRAPAHVARTTRRAGAPTAEEQCTVLVEEFDKEYVYTEKEIREYATWLCIDLKTEEHLLWIARAGLKATLPHPWKPCQPKGGGDVFYFNFQTGESVWDHPCDVYYRQLYREERARKGRATRDVRRTARQHSAF